MTARGAGATDGGATPGAAGFTLLPLPDREDGRGAAFYFDEETLRWLGEVAEVHVVGIAPGKARGNHRHHARREVVFVHHAGALEVAWQSPGDPAPTTRRFAGPGGFLARIEPMTLHAFRNAGEGFVEIVSMSNGRFSREETDYVTLLS